MLTNSSTGTTSIPTLHAAHVETMKRRFEEAKERINAMHQRAASGQPFSFMSPNPMEATFGDEVDFFNRIRRPQRPLVAPPHPELTPQQKQHISERTGNLENSSAQGFQYPAAKRFGGSVAERVMIFERCPIAALNDSSKGINEKRVNTAAPATAAAVTPNNSATVPPWKNLQQEGMGKVQVRIFHIPLKGSKGSLLGSCIHSAINLFISLWRLPVPLALKITFEVDAYYR